MNELAWGNDTQTTLKLISDAVTLQNVSSLLYGRIFALILSTNRDSVNQSYLRGSRSHQINYPSG